MVFSKTFVQNIFYKLLSKHLWRDFSFRKDPCFQHNSNNNDNNANDDNNYNNDYLFNVETYK